MLKISVIGIQLNSGFITEIETIALTDISDQTAIDLFDTDNYEVWVMEVERLDDE
jgi:hypothetical protein